MRSFSVHLVTSPPYTGSLVSVSQPQQCYVAKDAFIILVQGIQWCRGLADCLDTHSQYWTNRNSPWCFRCLVLLHLHLHLSLLYVFMIQTYLTTVLINWSGAPILM